MLEGYADLEDREAAKEGVARVRRAMPKMTAKGQQLPNEVHYSRMVAACGESKVAAGVGALPTAGHLDRG